MKLASLFLCAGALVAGCASESSTSEQPVTQPDLAGCVKIEGSDIGRLITLQVPAADGNGTVSITFTGWINKDGENNEYVGFDLDLEATFFVKSGTEIVEGSGTSFRNPNGTGGSTVKAISYVAICSAGESETTPPPPAPSCGDGVINGNEACDDGGVIDGDGCSAVCTIELPPPPPAPSCGDGMINGNEACDDGGVVDGDGCSAVCTIELPPPPPNPCDLNGDGDTTDPGECDYTCTDAE